MGFDASDVMRELDAQRVMREVDAQQALRDSLPFVSVSNSLRQYKNIAREISGVDRMLRDARGADRVLSMARVAGGARFAEMNKASLYADLVRSVFPASLRRGPLESIRNLASVGYYPRLQSDVLRHHRMIGDLGLSGSVAQAFRAQGIASAYSTAWSLHRVLSFRTPALQSFLKTTPTFGPIVVPPDYEDDAPFDYHPDLKGWLIPETATETGEVIDVEEMWAVVVAIAQAIAVNHRTKALLSVVGKDGRSFLVQVAGAVVGGLILYWILPP